MTNDNFSGTIPFTIRPASNTLEKTEMIAGLKWCAKVVIRQSGEFEEWYDMEFSICCEKDDCDQQQLWLTKAGIEIRMERREVNFGGSNKCLNLQFDHCFFNNNNSVTKHWNNFNFRWDVQKILIFEINVFRQIKSFIALDTNLIVTCNSKENDDEGKIAKKNIIVVNKNILTAISPHFAQLFSANWSEHQNGITIVEEEPEDVEAFQKIVYATMAMGWMMNVNDAKMLEEMLFYRSNNNDGDLEKYNFALRILFLAIKYDLSPVGQFAEDYILEQLNKYRIPKFELYEEASKFALPEPGLKERILASVNGDDFGIAENLDIFMRLDAKTQHILVERVRCAGKKMSFKMTMDKKNDLVRGRDWND